MYQLVYHIIRIDYKSISTHTRDFYIVSEDPPTVSNPLVREDKRCGPSFKLDNGSVSECDPYSDMYYCCSKWGFCGDTSEHCKCSECVDYRKIYSLNITEGNYIWYTSISKFPNNWLISSYKEELDFWLLDIEEVTETDIGNHTFRSDGKCGSNNPLPNGEPAECDPSPSSEYFCCSKWGYCGSTEEHCDCPDCINYRNPRPKGKIFYGNRK